MGILKAQTSSHNLTRDRGRSRRPTRHFGADICLRGQVRCWFQIGGLLFASPSLLISGLTSTHSRFQRPDVAATAVALREKGVTFNIYQGFGQDELVSGPHLAESCA